jgi:TonB-dependent receptor
MGGQARNTSMRRYDGGGYIINAGSNLASSADDLDVQTANVNQIFNYDPLNTTSSLRPAVVQSFVNTNTSEQWISASQMQNIVNAVRTTSPAFLSNGSGLSGFPSGWIAPNYSQSTQFFDTSHFNHDLVQQSLGRDGKTYPQPPTYDSAEHIRSAYLRADFEQPLFGYTIEGNIGLRYTGTRTTATGLQQYRFRVPRNNTDATFDDRISTNQLVVAERKYHDWLPSFNAATWLVPDQLVVRLGYGKVMARPAIDRLAPNINCLEGSGLVRLGGTGTDTCTAGNPDLKPYRAANKDISFEWYPNRDSQVSAAFFRKNIQSSIMTDVVVRKDVFGNGKQWDVTTSINYEGATTDGIELAGRTAFTFLPGFLSGFGADINYTRMKFKYASGAALINALDGSVLPFPGMSKNSYNIGFWYDKDRINARLAYNFRDPYYTGGTDVNTGNPVFSEKTGYLDGKIQFRWNDHLTISVEGKNLTDERTLTTAGSTLRPNELAWNGRRYFASLSYKY